MMPGHKALWHEVDHVSLTARVAGKALRIKLAEDLQQDECFAFSIAAGPAFLARAHAAWGLIQSHDSAFPQALAHKLKRPSPSAVTHMQTLQALDGERCGATLRQIARAVFGAFTDSEWAADSPWRARVRYLLKRGRAHSAHGYRRMIGADEAAGNLRGEGCGNAPSQPQMRPRSQNF
ncbi:MAG: DUF2285 domain-containing protein [Candidatus Eremiobacteraeota bacterium]|nr:DUF2285 domain-containing protein [Candidatus Eremiobacteraeota bacterium]